MNFLKYRPRRLRRTSKLRDLSAETSLAERDLVMPLFASDSGPQKAAIPAMPGQFRYSVSGLLRPIEKLLRAGVRAILLFGIPARKNERASQAYSDRGVVQKAIRAIKTRFPEMIVIADTCLCEYMSHGHCGLVRKIGKTYEILNDPTLELLAKTALSQAEAGADFVAPSDMMDGRVRAIRRALDRNGLSRTAILSYSAKYASVFYGPFREAAGSAPQFGDRKSYQMDMRNREEALREIGLDIREGADAVMIKPALAYLDVIHEAKQTFRFPIAAYNVSGEYAFVKWAAREGWDEKALVFEILTAIRRAGADWIITYHAADAAGWLKRQRAS